MLGTARISRGPGIWRGPEVVFCRGPSRIPCRDPPLPGAQIEDRFPLAAESTGISGLAERYAAALFELADERHALDAVAGDLRELRAMLRGERRSACGWCAARCCRATSRARRSPRSAERAGLSKLTRDFLGLVARNRRLFAVPAMIEAYLDEARRAARRGHRRGDRGAAADDGAAGRARRAAAPRRRAAGSRSTSRVDPSLLGGLIVKIGSRMVDARSRASCSACS